MPEGLGRSWTIAVVIFVMTLLAAACGDDGEGAAEPAEPLETELITDIEYHPLDDRFTADSGLTDVIAPTEGGTWPTVVVFHGDPRSASKAWHRRDATAIAEHGRVVFLPAWGHSTSSSEADELADTWGLMAKEVTCAVAFAAATTADYGGDPDHIVLYGLSAGGNAVLMAGFADAAPLDTCAATDPVTPDALVPIDADWVLGGDWDRQLSENPEAFYAFTPWRHLDGTPDVPIHVMVAENLDAYVRPVGDDPATSWLSYRHTDIDLSADLDERGYLDDGSFGLWESGEYASQELLDAGYDASFIEIPNATHGGWSSAEALDVIVDTVLNAE